MNISKKKKTYWHMQLIEGFFGGQILYVCVAQYTIMPVVGAVIGKFLGLPPGLSVGLILLGCCPGGIASSVVIICLFSSFLYFHYFPRFSISKDGGLVFCWLVRCLLMFNFLLYIYFFSEHTFLLGIYYIFYSIKY